MNRPLSPHLSVYRWQITNTLSIVHRLTGVTLSVGAFVFTVWLTAIAMGPDAYGIVIGWLRSPIGLLLMFGFTLCFFFHLCNGIRHLFWDAGYGFEMRQVRLSGMTVVVAAMILNLVFWLVALTGGAG